MSASPPSVALRSARDFRLRMESIGSSWTAPGSRDPPSPIQAASPTPVARFLDDMANLRSSGDSTSSPGPIARYLSNEPPDLRFRSSGDRTSFPLFLPSQMTGRHPDPLSPEYDLPPGSTPGIAPLDLLPILASPSLGPDYDDPDEHMPGYHGSGDPSGDGTPAMNGYHLGDPGRLELRALAEAQAAVAAAHENSPFTQEADMSASEDHPHERLPGRDLTQEDLTEAREWLSGVGLDADLVRGFSARLDEVVAATLDEVVRCEDAVAVLQTYMRCWTEALEATHHAIDKAERASEGTDRADLEVLWQARAGLQAVVDLTQTRTKGCEEDRKRHDARVAVLRELRDQLQDSAAPPWCSICIARPVDTVAQPCGHLFCKGCAKRMMTAGGAGGGRRGSSGPKPCYTCRRACKGTMPVYF